MILLLSVLGAALTLAFPAAGPKDCGPEPPLPIAHGQDELRTAMIDVMHYLKARPITKVEFRKLVGPYAPLDLEVRSHSTEDVASSVKNFFFGVAGSFAGSDESRHLVPRRRSTRTDGG
jgi:hypothetical protein